MDCPGSSTLHGEKAREQSEMPTFDFVAKRTCLVLIQNHLLWRKLAGNSLLGPCDTAQTGRSKAEREGTYGHRDNLGTPRISLSPVVVSGAAGA